MLQAIGSLIMILTTVVPAVYTIAKVFPWIQRLLRHFWLFARFGGTWMQRSVFWASLIGIFSFVGGFGFLVSLYLGFGFEYYLKFFDFVFTPVAYAVENLLRAFVSQLPNLPANTSSMLCLFDFSRCITLLTVGFCFEVYMRCLIYLLVRKHGF